MSAKVEISRTDRTVDDLKAMAKKSKCKDHRRRLRAIARVLAGEASRSEVAKRARVDVQTLRDWVRRYNEEGAHGLRNRPRSGRRARLDADQAEAVREWLEAGPDPGAGEPARWTVADIRRRIENLFEINCSVEGVRLPVRRLGFRNVSTRPIHPKADPRAQEEFRNNFKELARKVLPSGVSLENAGVRFRDEARIGQKGMLSRVWARKGTRPHLRRPARYRARRRRGELFAGPASGGGPLQRRDRRAPGERLDLRIDAPFGRAEPGQAQGEGGRRAGPGVGAVRDGAAGSGQSRPRPGRRRHGNSRGIAGGCGPRGQAGGRLGEDPRGQSGVSGHFATPRFRVEPGRPGFYLRAGQILARRASDECSGKDFRKAGGQERRRVARDRGRFRARGKDRRRAKRRPPHGAEDAAPP